MLRLDATTLRRLADAKGRKFTVKPVCREIILPTSPLYLGHPWHCEPLMSVSVFRRLLPTLLLLTPLWAMAQNNAHALGGPQREGKTGHQWDPQPQPEPSLPAVPATEFDCANPANPMESMICQDEGLTRLDNRLKKVYAQAQDKAHQSKGATASAKLLQEQRKWARNLKDCMKSDNPHMCLGDTYIQRITELQAAWELAPSLTPLRYLCGGNTEILATFYRTKPATARLVRGKNEAILHQQELVAGGARYAGQNVEFTLKGKEAALNWKGDNLLCISQPEH